MPGIQLHASVADNFLSNRFIRPASRRGAARTVGIAALVVGLLAALLPFAPAAAVTLALVAAGPGLRSPRSRTASWLNMVAAAARDRRSRCLPARPTSYFVEGREKRDVKKLFGRYVSPRRLQAAASTHPELAELGGEAPRDVGPLFRHPRLHHGDGKGQCRGARRAAERVFLADGRRSCSATTARSTSSSATW